MRAPASLLLLAATAAPAHAQNCLQIESAPMLPADAGLGFSVAMDDDHAIAGAPDAQQVAVWKRVGNTWQFHQVLYPNGDSQSDVNTFGYSLDVEGDLIAVGCRQSDQVQVFVLEPATGFFEYSDTVFPNDLTSNDDFGHDVTIEAGAVIAASLQDDSNGANAGAVYVFESTGPGWSQTQKLIAPDGAPGDFFGVAIDAFADVLVIGAVYDQDAGVGSGSAYVYRRDAQGQWGFEEKLLPQNSGVNHYFGVSVAVSNGGIVVGAEGDDDLGAGAGAAYVFRDVAGSWEEHDKLIAWDGAAGDGLGFSVASSGACYDVATRAHNAGSGAVYRFFVDDVGPTPVQKFEPTMVGSGLAFGSAVDMPAGNPYGGIIGVPHGGTPGGAVAFPIYTTSGFEDCNDNLVDDLCELVAGMAVDNDGDGILNECDPTPGGVLWVDANTPTPLIEDGSQLYPFDTIQEALMVPSVSSPNTVIIRPGLYFEDLTMGSEFPAWLAGEFGTIKAEFSGTVMLIGSMRFDGYYNNLVEGITIAYSDVGVVWGGTPVTFENCRITRSSMLMSEGAITLRNCHMDYSSIRGSYCTLKIYDSVLYGRPKHTRWIIDLGENGFEIENTLYPPKTIRIENSPFDPEPYTYL